MDLLERQGSNNTIMQLRLVTGKLVLHHYMNTIHKFCLAMPLCCPAQQSDPNQALLLLPINKQINNWVHFSDSSQIVCPFTPSTVLLSSTSQTQCMCTTNSLFLLPNTFMTEWNCAALLKSIFIGYCGRLRATKIYNFAVCLKEFLYELYFQI